MASKNPSERVTTARIAALTRWGKATTDERRTGTQAARDGVLARFEAQADPDGRMTPQERRDAALRLRRAHMTSLSRLAARKRAQS